MLTRHEPKCPVAGDPIYVIGPKVRIQEWSSDGGGGMGSARASERVCSHECEGEMRNVCVCVCVYMLRVD